MCSLGFRILAGPALGKSARARASIKKLSLLNVDGRVCVVGFDFEPELR